MKKIYYARDEDDKIIDEVIRNVIMKEGTPVEKNLYIQNNMIISLLREISDNIKEIKEILKGAKDE